MAREQVKLSGDKMINYINDVVGSTKRGTPSGGYNIMLLPIAEAVAADGRQKGFITTQSVNATVGAFRAIHENNIPATDAAEEFLLEKLAKHAQPERVTVAPMGGAAGHAK